MWQWAARDLMRRPWESILTGLALVSLLVLGGSFLSLTEAVSKTAEDALSAGPSLVVRRLGPLGFEAMPSSAVAPLAKVPGALDVRLRVWGHAAIQDSRLESPQPVSLLAFDPEQHGDWTQTASLGPKEALVGAGLSLEPGAVFKLRGPGGEGSYEVKAQLPESGGLVSFDAILLDPGEARRLLGLAPSTGSDVALRVFRDTEELAIREDLQKALPFWVSISAKSQAMSQVRARMSWRGSLLSMALLPAALALALLVASGLRQGQRRRRELGLMKAMGWTSQDLMRLFTARALLIALPSFGLGAIAVWALLYGPWVRWPAAWLFGWTAVPPPLHLDSGTLLMPWLTVSALVLLPWLLASLWPVALSSSEDPWDLMGGGDGL